MSITIEVYITANHPDDPKGVMSVGMKAFDDGSAQVSEMMVSNVVTEAIRITMEKLQSMAPGLREINRRESLGSDMTKEEFEALVESFTVEVKH